MDWCRSLGRLSDRAVALPQLPGVCERLFKEPVESAALAPMLQQRMVRMVEAGLLHRAFAVRRQAALALPALLPLLAARTAVVEQLAAALGADAPLPTPAQAPPPSPHSLATACRPN